ncbi:Putative NAD(P)H nitroreductase YdjA [Variovorax sp. PBS-H4]|uniref:nitroreductase family protein n=1 Tax=Variovorax sp. PBS-H4 TaxID=434008 RepID=UPI00131733CE|nr:nitroreductase [Variovorax sp. PBS-H4]VTU32574.1 Putative NAD(P)H nitroreductase YdjA [Variovorax sp. PBS-H4]
MSSSMEHGVSSPGAADPPVTERQLAELLHTRRTVLPRRLGAPGPTQPELEHILGAAAAAPDHGGLVPWRFVIVPPPQRGRLGEVLARSLEERDTAATPDQRGMEREKAFQAPVLMLAIVRLGPQNEQIPATERILSAGCAIQNMLLTATVLGYGSALTSGESLQSAELRALFGVEEHEEPLCFISVGTVLAHKEGPARPALERYVSQLGPVRGH